MKKTILILGSLALIVNVLLGLLLSKYDYFNMEVNCGVIALNSALLFCLWQFNLRDAFRISFTFLFSILGIAELVLGCLMPQKLQDNGNLIVCIVLIFIEITLLTATNILSDKINVTGK